MTLAVFERVGFELAALVLVTFVVTFLLLVAVTLVVVETAFVVVTGLAVDVALTEVRGLAVDATGAAELPPQALEIAA